MFQRCDTGCNTAFHVEHAPTGNVISALEVGECLFLVRCKRTAGKIGQKSFQQSIRLESKMFQIAIICSFHHIEVPRQSQSSSPGAAHDGDNILGHRRAVTVDDGNIFRVLLEIGDLAQKLGQLRPERCLVRCSRFARPSHHAIGEFSHPFCRVPFIWGCHGLSSLNSSPSPCLGEGTGGFSNLV